MSHENVRVARRSVDAINNPDLFMRFDGLDPEAEIQDYPGLPDAEWHRGLKGVVAWLTRLREAFGEFQLEMSNVVEVPPDRVLFDWHATGASRTHGIPLSLVGATVYTFRERKIVRAEVFLTRDDALESVGLTE